MDTRIQDTLAYKIISHLLPWLIVFFLPKLIFGINISKDVPRMHFMFYINLFLVILFFYLNKYIFVPWLFLNHRYVFYVIAFLISITFGFAFTKIMCNELIPDIYNGYFQNLEDEKVYLSESDNIDQLNAIERLRGNKHYYRNFINAEPVSNPVKSVFAIIIAFTVSTTLTISKKWHQNELQKRELVKDHFETELMFLKSQVNPHFLFNTLNSIYSMAVKKSDKTADTIVKLSSLIRYMLYDSDKDFVELEEELIYIRNYIELQSIRLHDDVNLQFQINGKAEGKLIAPMLLVPIIENAFKHGIDYTIKSYVDINITVDKDELSVRIKNSKNKFITEQADKNSGIGLKNVKRRLEMVYPDKHLLDINESDDLFDVSLTLNLSDNEMPYS